MRRCCALPARDRDRAEPIIIDGEAGTGSNEAYPKKEPQVFGPRGEGPEAFRHLVCTARNRAT